MVAPDAHKGEKVILMGLDNSGKTSILLSLQGNYNLMTYFSLKPTQGMQISEVKSLTEQYYVWDFGGQDIYRKRYFEDIAVYLEHTKRMIYVIDIQDRARMEQALDYFKRIVENLGEGEPPVKIAVYLHKYDPSLEVDDKSRSSLEKYVDDLKTKIKGIVPAGLSCQIFKSTIYTIFRKSLIS